MKNHAPYTPFSTRLSRSAKEAEIRLRNISSGPKKRPPILLLILMACVCVFCGNLVSCQMAEAEVSPDSSTSASTSSNASIPEQPPEAWTPVELDTGLLQYNETTLDKPYEFLTEAEITLLQDLPAEELPKEAVELSSALRQDYWKDILLPTAYTEEEDITVYFVVGGMPDVEPLVHPAMWDLQQDGIILRHGGRTAYFPLYWGGNAHFGNNPLLFVDDFNQDGQPEAALSLTMGWGTGCLSEDLYIFDLDAMTYSLLDYSDIPLEITASSDGKTAKVLSGEQECTADLTRLHSPFPGEVELGNQIVFQLIDGQFVCHLELDFGCNTLGYLTGADFPLVFEGGVYRLGPATALYDNLNT